MASIEQRLEAARAKIGRLTPQAAASAIEEGATIVDTRCRDDRDAEGTVPGSIHHPLSVLEWRADPSSDTSDPMIADFDARLILMCNDGFSSSFAGERLVDIGHRNVADVIGGFRAWSQAGLPVS